MIQALKIIRETHLALVGIWSLWLVWGGMLENPGLSGFALVPAFFLLTAIWPRLGLVVFVVMALPLGGAYPGTPATSLFLRMLSGVCAGLWLRHIRFIRSPAPSLVPISLRQPVFLFLVVFCLTAVGSLLSIPIDEWGVRFSQLGATKSQAIVQVKETWVLFSLLRCMVILSGLGLMVMICEEVRRGFQYLPRFLLLAGLGSYAWVLVLGLLDYFGAFSLTWLRDIATGVKPDGTPLRLQSLFGHPAWCAMYVSALAPTVVVLFDLSLKPFIRNTLVIALLVLGEYVLILTFARGGWVSYPFTLLAIWGCIYTLGVKNRGEEYQQSPPRLWRKIIISLPVTVLFSVGIMLVSEKGDYDRYANRLKAVANATDRTVYIDPALKLAREHPVMGGGVGAFAYRYTNDFVIPTGKFYSPAGGPLNRTFNNAHSLWLGLLVGQGGLGVFAMAGILLATAWSTREGLKVVGNQRVINKPNLIENLSWVALLCSTVSLGVYGIFDDTLYPSSNVVALFVLAAATLGASKSSRHIPPVYVRWVFLVACLGFVGQGIFEFIWPGQARHLTVDPGPDGCYRNTQDASEGRFRVWCSEHAKIEAPIRVVEGQAYASFELVVAPNDEVATDVTLSLAESPPASRIPHVFSVPQGEPFWLLIPLGNEFRALQSVRLDLKSSTYLVPLRNPKIQSLDRRRLSFSLPSILTAFSEDAEHHAKCIQVQAVDVDWNDFWCAGGGLIQIPSAEGGLFDVSVRLTHEPTLREGATYIAFSLGDHTESSILTLRDAGRVLLAKNFDPRVSKGLQVASTRPARILDPTGKSGFVVGFRRIRP